MMKMFLNLITLGVGKLEYVTLLKNLFNYTTSFITFFKLQSSRWNDIQELQPIQKANLKY